MFLVSIVLSVFVGRVVLFCGRVGDEGGDNSVDPKFLDADKAIVAQASYYEIYAARSVISSTFLVGFCIVRYFVVVFVVGLYGGYLWAVWCLVSVLFFFFFINFSANVRNNFLCVKLADSCPPLLPPPPPLLQYWA